MWALHAVAELGRFAATFDVTDVAEIFLNSSDPLFSDPSVRRSEAGWKPQLVGFVR